MPAFDGTGPMGQGPMTGRGMGRCAGYGFNYGGRAGRGFGRAYGLGRSFGFGWRRPTKSDEISESKNYLKDLKDEIKEVENYLKKLQTEK